MLKKAICFLFMVSFFTAFNGYALEEVGSSDESEIEVVSLDPDTGVVDASDSDCTSEEGSNRE